MCGETQHDAWQPCAATCDPATLRSPPPRHPYPHPHPHPASPLHRIENSIDGEVARRKTLAEALRDQVDNRFDELKEIEESNRGK